MLEFAGEFVERPDPRHRPRAAIPSSSPPDRALRLRLRLGRAPAEDGGGTQISHGGSNDIFYAQWLWFPEQELFIYVMTNNSRHPATEVARLIRATLESA
jgi:hypothetical protein